MRIPLFTDEDAWRNRRYEIAKDAMAAFISAREFEQTSPQSMAQSAVLYADALIAELRKEE